MCAPYGASIRRPIFPSRQSHAKAAWQPQDLVLLVWNLRVGLMVELGDIGFRFLSQ